MMSKDKHHHSHAHDVMEKAAKTLAAVAIAGTLAAGTDLGKDPSNLSFGITAEAAELGSGTTTENLNLRKGAGTGNAVIKVLPKGTKLSILEKSNGWLKVSANGSEGWVSAEYVNEGGTQTAHVQQATGSGTTTEHLNLRKGVGTGNAVIKVLPKGTKLEILSSSNGWLKVVANGTEGWVSSEYVSQGGGSQAAPTEKPKQQEQAPSQSQGTGTTTENLNLRKGAGTSNAVIKVLPKGTKLEILSSSNGWLKVVANGTEGWVSSEYVSQGSQAAPTEKPKQQEQAPSQSQGTGTTTENLNLRKGAGTSNAVIKVLPKGTKLEILSSSNGWLKVVANGTEGWVSAEYVNQGGTSTTAPSAPTTTAKTGTTTENLNLRKGTGTGNAVIKVLPKGTKLEILSSSNGWLKVKALGSEGWVSAEYVNQGGASSSGTQSSSRYATVLSTVTSYYSTGDWARSSNVELAASKINGLVLQPGQSYSFANSVGPVTSGNGYQNATVFVGDALSTDMGGGICQVSSTLYYAQLKAGITNGERHNHSRAVGYVPLGLDATMWEGSLDHSFTNPYDVPIQIVASAGGGVLTIEVRADGDALKGYSYEPRTVLVSKSGNKETWDTYLQTYRNGNYVSEKYLHRSTYTMY